MATRVGQEWVLDETVTEMPPGAPSAVGPMVAMPSTQYVSVDAAALSRKRAMGLGLLLGVAGMFLVPRALGWLFATDMK